ncbi:DNA primase family protein [Levilactobacillus brevis]|uniref:DNA primase family protein n=1 Tax=Levilactobacillus brevis TaxID=1580 RepID=UPI0029363925|nr:phage/plasmid primase, P4 family [Levilactobacillus brevis]MDV2567079.1 phage/plasmid primase, P4 family [Levilactobacillus brevis]MDV2585876.1 phage/plasmid primase, P4 family [Levilactobacillus brevis]
MNEIPSETQELLANYHDKKRLSVVVSKDGNAIDEGLTPMDVNLIEAPDPATLANPEALKEFNEQLNQQVPSWINAYYKADGKNDPKPVLKVFVSEIVLGDKLIKHDHLISFPMLKEGAVYLDITGTWRMFKDKDAVAYIETRLTHILKPWGVYNDGNIARARHYTQRFMYQANRLDNPFDHANPNLVAFRNGTFNMATGKLESKNPENYLLNGHDYDLDVSGMMTPRTDALLRDMVGNAATFLKEYIGYGFYHSYRPFQKIVFLSGSGGEGKSTFLVDLLARTLYGADNYVAVPPDELAGNDARFKPAQLYGREVNIVADIPKGYLSNTAVLKKLSGGDPIDAEFKGMQNFTFINYAKMIFSANALPSFTDSSNGMTERLVLIKFVNGDTRTAYKDFWKEHDMQLVKAERSAFAYKCLKAFMAAMKRGSLTETDDMKLARDEWVNLNDHFGQFIEEACEIDTSKDEGDSSKSVVAEYKAFCLENNYSDKTTAQTITENLKAYGVQKVRSRNGVNDSNNTKRFKGLKLTKSYINPAIN